MYDNLIKRLRRCASYDPRFVIQDCEDAADAIEELQRSKCPHYIRNVHDRGDDSLCDKWMCEVKSLPKWIPVTERLPEERGSYLIVENGIVQEAFYGKEWAGDNWTDPVEMYMTFHPTHWMPLPELPKDGES